MNRTEKNTTLPAYAAPARPAAALGLDLNENRWGCPPRVRRALAGLRPADLAAYPDPAPFTRRLARHLHLPADWVLVTAGADQAIQLFFQAAVAPGESVLLAVPAFSMYAWHAARRGALLRQVSFRSDFSFPLAEYIAALGERPRLAVLIQPNNPTGTPLRRDELEAVLQAAGDVPVVLDETYIVFSGESGVDLLRRFANLIVLRSFSKGWGLAGLRLGCVLARPEWLRRLREWQPPFTVNTAALAAGAAALEDRAWPAACRRRVAREKEFLCRGLRAAGLAVHPGAANFVLARLEGAVDAARRLRRCGIWVKSLEDEPGLAGWLRLTVGRRGENERLLAALAVCRPLSIVLFDMDGVLLDVTRSYDRALRLVAARFLGRPVRAAEVAAVKRLGGCNNDWQACRELLQRAGRTVSEREITALFQEVVHGRDGEGLLAAERWRIPPASLRRLAERCGLGIVTGRPRAEAEWSLERAGVLDLFRVVIAMEETGERPKPDPLGIRLALGRMGPGRAVYIGDGVDDMAAARAASVVAVGVTAPGRGARARQERDLYRAGAHWVARESREILEVLS